MIKAYAKSDIGKVREINQDYYYISDSLDEVQLYMLADGMGGYNGGEIASKLAIQSAKSYIENNPDIIKKFRNAINKALKFVYEENNETIAKSLLEFFPDTSLEDITKIINRYKEPKAWKENITINKEEWDHIQEIVISANQLDKKVDIV